MILCQATQAKGGGAEEAGELGARASRATLGRAARIPSTTTRPQELWAGAGNHSETLGLASEATPPSVAGRYDSGDATLKPVQRGR